jgi:hypothetical protein
MGAFGLITGCYAITKISSYEIGLHLLGVLAAINFYTIR